MDKRIKDLRLFRVPFIGETPKDLIREFKSGLKIYFNNEPELWRSAMYDYRDYAFELKKENDQLKKELDKNGQKTKHHRSSSK